MVVSGLEHVVYYFEEYTARDRQRLFGSLLSPSRLTPYLLHTLTEYGLHLVVATTMAVVCPLVVMILLVV